MKPAQQDTPEPADTDVTNVGLWGFARVEQRKCTGCLSECSNLLKRTELCVFLLLDCMTDVSKIMSDSD